MNKKFKFLLMILALTFSNFSWADNEFLDSLPQVNDNRVNGRDFPDVKLGAIMFQLKSGTKVIVRHKTNELETIGGTTSYWYEVEPQDGDHKGKVCWIFDQFLSFQKGFEEQYWQGTAFKIGQIDKKTIIKKNDPTPKIYDHRQRLIFEWSGYYTKVLKTPLLDKVIYTIMKGDVIDITNIIEYKSLNKTFIKVKIPTGEIGYIKIGWNPYKNGEYSYIETIKIKGENVKVLKMTQSFEVSDGVFMKILPSDSSKTLHEVTHAEGMSVYEASAITSDYKWVKIKIEGFVGWVPSNSLSVGRGGPTILYPEAVVFFDLIGSNEI